MTPTMPTSIHHSFDIHLAAKYGISEAILIHHFQHWIMVNKRLKRNEHEGRTWTYQTLNEIAAHFPYMTKEDVRGCIEYLCTGIGRRSKKDIPDFEPILLKGNFNKRKFDKTVWYAFVDESIFSNNLYEREHSHLDMGDLPPPCGRSPTPIPDTKPDTKPDKDTSLKVSPDKSGESAKASKKEIIFSEEVKDICETMLAEMRKLKPDFKFSKAQAKNWCTEVDAMIKLDKRDPLTIMEVFRWGLSSWWKPQFFKPNPPKFLRGKFDQFEVQMLTPKPQATPKKTYPNGWAPETEQEAEWARINTAFFKKEKAESNGKMNHLYIDARGFLNNTRDRTKDATIKVPPEQFIKLIESVGGVTYDGV